MKDIILFKLDPQPTLFEMYIFHRGLGIAAVINDGDVHFIIERGDNDD